MKKEKEEHRHRVGGRWLPLLGLSLSLILPTIAHAASSGTVPTASITENVSHLQLNPYLALFEDQKSTLGFDQVRESDRNGDFINLGGKSPNFGFTASAWWVRLTLNNPDKKTRQVILRQDYPLIDHLEFWSPNTEGGWQRTVTGDRVPFTERPLDHRAFLFPVDLPPNSETTFYLRFQTQGALNIGLSAHSPADLVNLITEEYLALGIYYGGFMVLLVYNLIMFLTVRDRAFAYYLLYVVSYGLYFSVHNGLSFQYLWPDNPWLGNQSLLILLALSLLGCVRFTREILSAATLIPRADKIAFAMEISMVVALVAAPFLSYRTMIVPMAVMTAVICVHMLAMGTLALIRGSGPARYYMVAFTALFVGVLVYMLKTFGLMPHNAFTQNAFQFASLIEMVLLSLAIGSRVSEMRQHSYLDALTRLHNRRYFNERIFVEFQKAGRRSHPLSLLIMDIDHFKLFNDTHGHTQGDQALRTVARILEASTRKPAIVCRYGGEEFVVIMPNASDSDVTTVAERIRSKIQQDTAATFQLSVSVGHATLDGSNFDSPQALFDAADAALYAAKDGGRNRVVNYVNCRTQHLAGQTKSGLATAPPA